MIDARNQPRKFLQAVTRFAELTCDAALSYGVKAEHILNGGRTKKDRVVLARMDILQAIDREFILSLPQVAILFRYQNHTTIHLMRRRIQEKIEPWRLPIHN